MSLRLHTFESRKLCWFYRIAVPPLIALLASALISGPAWYFIPTDVLAVVLWTYLWLSAWIRGSK